MILVNTKFYKTAFEILRLRYRKHLCSPKIFIAILFRFCNENKLERQQGERYCLLASVNQNKELLMWKINIPFQR